MSDNNQNINGAIPSNNLPQEGNGLNVNQDAVNGDFFNPNKLLSAVQTYKTLNTIANKMFGIEARWFRAVPQQRSKDVIFQEYTLSNVEDEPICLNVLIPDGQTIESKYNYDLMGLEYELPFEIQIDKLYWEEMAGFGTAPQKKDIVYLPMPNKLFQVESTYLKRGFMEQETHWVVNLRKYSPEASRKESKELQETIDQYTVSEEEIFGDLIQDDVTKLTNDKQMSQLNSTTEDKYKEFDKNLQTINYNLEIGGIIVAESMYDLSTSSNKVAVTYKNSKDLINNENSRSVLAWFNNKNNKEKQNLVTKIVPDDTITYPANYKVYIRGNSLLQNGDIIQISKTDTLTIYATVIDNKLKMSGIYYIKIDDDVLKYIESIQNKWYLTKGWKAEKIYSINILTGGTNKSKFKTELIANKFVKVQYGETENVFTIPNTLKNGKWYGLVVNLGYVWSQLNINIWEESETGISEDKLQSIYQKTVSIKPNNIEIDKYYIDKSNSYLTNIRLFNQTIEEEKQSNELLSYLSKNANNGLILDNADNRLDIPYISKQR